MQILRKVFFYCFLIIYLTVCPFLVLYAFGYIFNPKNLKIIQTGLLSLATIPPHATIYIGKSRYKDKTPAVISGLIPGKYSIKLLHKEYQPWSKEVSIAAGKTLLFENSILIPWHWKTREISARSFKEMIPLPETSYVLLAMSHKLKDYYVYDRKEERLWPLMAEDGSLGNAKVLERFTIRGAPGLLFCLEGEGKKRYAWIELKERMPKLKDMSSLFLEEPLYVDAPPNDMRFLFSFEKGYLTRMDAIAEAVFPKYLEGLRGFGISSKHLYILTNDNTLQRLNYDKTNGEEIAIDEALSKNPLFATRNFLKIKAFEKNIFVFRSQRGEFFISYLSYVFADKGILGVEFDKGSKKLLFWKKDKIGVLDFSGVGQESGLLEKKPQMRWIYANAEDISACFWALRGSYLIFQDKAGVYLLEAQGDGEVLCTLITQAKKDASIWYAEDAGMLYYLEPRAGRLMSLEIIPKSHLSLLLLPQRVTQDTESKE